MFFMDCMSARAGRDTKINDEPAAINDTTNAAATVANTKASSSSSGVKLGRRQREQQPIAAGDAGGRRSDASAGGRVNQASGKTSANKSYISQFDPLFHLYLICVGLITMSILAIKCLIPGMPIYMHTIMGFAFIISAIIASMIYIYFKQMKISSHLRVLLWFIISGSLTMLQLLDLIVPDDQFDKHGELIDEQQRLESMNCAFAWYYTFTIIMAMTATSIFIRINVWLKLLVHVATIVIYVWINNRQQSATSSTTSTLLDLIKEFIESPATNWSFLDHKQKFTHLYYIILIAVVLHLIDRQVEYILSLNIQWNKQLESDRCESQTVGQINRILLENILPPHVLSRYLYNTSVSYDQLYHESHNSCAVMFASIPNYETLISSPWTTSSHH
ncbi:Adenylate cyclase type 2, partial [Fragariocoptes setiger]